jgi:LuxR family maltose regulon positive regulatory protein
LSTDHILATKLVIPTSPTRLVPRPRLERPAEAPAVILVCAPAGYGKTTLIAGWASASQAKVAWLSLDADDNEPLRFLTHFICAIQTQFADFGLAVSGMLAASPPPPVGGLMRSLVNQLFDLPEPLCIILDDLHTVDDASVLKAIVFLIEHQPPQLQLILASRSDPAFSLARIRGQGKLLEYRTRDLRFTVQEADAFCNEVMHFGLPQSQVETLATRTEGWIVGLQLAALSLHGAADKAGFIDSFAGDDRHITDFLLDEVLRCRSDDMQEFLLQTSLLERFNASLCDAVTLRQDSRSMIDELERSNMFILGLDHQRVWYRYHHLFDSLLRSRLQQARPALVKELHRRASQWLRSNGLIAEAVNHAIKAGDHEDAIDLIELQGSVLFSHGLISTALVWARQLPPALLRQRPKFSLTCAWANFYVDNLPAMETYICSVEHCLADFKDAPVSSKERAMLGQAALLRGCQFAYSGNLEAAMRDLRHAFSGLADGRSLHAVAAVSLGVCYFVSARYQEAQALFSAHAVVAEARGNVLIPITAVFAQARMQLLRGRLPAAKKLYENALHECGNAGWQDFPACGMLHIGLGELAYEMNDLAGAEKHLRRGIDMTASGMQYCNAWGHVLLAQTRLAMGLTDNILDPERELALAKYSGRFVVDIPPLSAAFARLWAGQGRLDALQQWRDEAGLPQGGELAIGREAEYLALARCLIAAGEADAALDLVQRLWPGAEEGQRLAVMIEIRILQALALQAGKQGSEALAVLQQGLDLARNTGLVRLFVDAGAPLADLLKKLARGADFTSSALALLPHFTANGAEQAPEAAFAQLFSKKEKQVVSFVVKGESNQKIAESLFISPNTLHSHMKNIYAKLGVNSRLQAIDQLRKLGLD